MSINHTALLAQGLAAVRFEDVPAQALTNMKRSIMENLSAAVAARATVPYMQKLDAALVSPAAGKATVFGGDQNRSPEQAAFVNASCAVVKEFIGGHRFSYGMPSIAAVPVAFALGESRNASGQEVLLAALLGYEAHARIGVATYPMQFRFHPHGTLGVYGAAGAAASILDLSAAEWSDLLDLVSVLPVFSHRRTTVEGGTVRNIFPGLSAHTGIMSVQMLRAGFSGVENGISSCFVETSADALDEEKLLSGLGSRFEVCRNYYKLYGCERHLHGSMDAVYNLREELGAGVLTPDSVESVVVHTHLKGARCKRKEPQNGMASQWSIPHGVAALLTLGEEEDLFSEQAVANPAIRALAARVDVFEDPEYTRLDPEERYTRLCLTLKDGRSFTRVVHRLLGEFDSDFPDEAVRKRLYAKCRRLFLRGGKGEAETERLIAMIENLEQLESIRALTSLLAAAK